MMKAIRPAGTVCLQVAAGILKRRGYDTGAKAIFAQLRAMGLLEGSKATAKALRENLIREVDGSFDNGFYDGAYKRAFLTRRGFKALEDYLQEKAGQLGGEAAYKAALRTVNIDLGNGEQCNLGF